MNPMAHLQKKTKVPLAGFSRAANTKHQPFPTLQIVVQKMDADTSKRERFGSISFNLKKFLNSTAQSFTHWVTLYDSLDDDLFEGQLGRDDEFDYPRVLLDY